MSGGTQVTGEEEGPSRPASGAKSGRTEEVKRSSRARVPEIPEIEQPTGCMLEKEMAAHSSILTWRIPRTGEPGGLRSMGSQRVGHN